MIERINEYNPDYAIHPGEILDETLEARGISSAEMAKRIGLTEKTLSEIINGKAPVTPDTAVRLESILGIKADVWNNLESNYQLFKVRQKQQEEFKKNIDWARSFPLKELRKYGIVSDTRNQIIIVKELLSFFGVSSIHSWNELYESPAVQFRRSSAYKIDEKSVSTWLRFSELLAHEMQTKNFNKRSFERALSEIRSLTLEGSDQFSDRLTVLCAEAGVALVFLSEFPKTRISGATRWLSSRKAMISLTLRYKTDDQFWFSFYHEAGHILKHGKQRVFIDGEDHSEDTLEREADNFARDILIPPGKYEKFVSRGKLYKDDIQSFANEIGIAPGIVVGRLQHDGYIKYNLHNDLKRRIRLTVTND